MSARTPFREPDPLDPPPAGSTWVELQLVDDLGTPIAGERFEIELPDGTVASGTTGPDGTARLRGIPSGTCRVTLPRLDGALWEPAWTAFVQPPVAPVSSRGRTPERR